MEIDSGFQKLGDYISGARPARKKPPAYEWQELALKVIKEVNAPAFKRSAVFKIVKANPRAKIEMALADTLELCQTGEKWKYFFKILDNSGNEKKRPEPFTQNN